MEKTEMSSLDELQHEIGSWGKSTFPNSDAGTIADHLAEEVIELLGTERVYAALGRAVVKDGWCPTIAPATDPAAESADCVMLLLHLAYRLNFSLDAAVRAKFAEVQTRKWDDGEGRGYSRHVDGGTYGRSRQNSEGI